MVYSEIRQEEKPMMTVNEMSKRTGVSARTLHYYDQIGLLKPEAHTAGCMEKRRWNGWAAF